VAECRPLRLEVGKIKVDQLKAIRATLVLTMCYNCVDGPNDLIRHYQLNMRIIQVLDLVANALVIDQLS